MRDEIFDRFDAEREDRECDLGVCHRRRGDVLHTAELEIGNHSLVVFVVGKFNAGEFFVNAKHVLCFAVSFGDDRLACPGKRNMSSGMSPYVVLHGGHICR